MTPARAIGVTRLALPLLAMLAGCDPRDEASGTKQKPQTSAALQQEMRAQMSGSVGSEYCPAQLARSFAAKAPPFSSLDDCNRNLAIFTVASKKVLGREGEPLQIAMATDGRFEYILQRDLIPSHEIARVQQEWREDMKEYEQIPGYEMYFWGGSVGTRMSDGLEIRHVRYWNKHKGIFCLGTSSSEITMKCLWGTPQGRFQVWFSFDDLKQVLRYLGSAAAT